MNVNLKSDFPVTDESCQAATGKTMTDWIAEVDAQPDLAKSRRYAISWMYDQMGRGNDMWWATTTWVEKERRAGIVQKDGRAEGYNICVNKTIAAPIATVFAAWSGAGLEGWWGDSPTEKEGSITDAQGNQATAARIRENKDLRYRWQTAGGEDVTQVDVTFTAKGEKTVISLMHQRIQTREEADGLRHAWSEAFDRLKKALE
ncbi:MAG: SRPBCC family protein [Fimbriimonas sp.]